MMWLLYGLIICLSVAVFWARQDGKKAARLQALKQEAKEVARVQNIMQRVEHLPADAVRERLRRAGR